MFPSDLTRDDQAARITRRAFLTAGTAVTALIAVAVLREGPGMEASVTVHGTPGQVTLVNFSDDGRDLGKVTLPKVVKTDGEWFRQLGRNSFNIARQADTEMPYSGISLNEHSSGVFRCLGCDTALFSSKTKFDSGTGWPSFWAPIAHENLLEKTDSSLGMERTEVRCARCEGHLGHVFSDGPDPTGRRYCMNSASMRFARARTA